MKRFAVLVLALSLAACTDEPGAKLALDAAGYTNIEVGGWAVLSCADDDVYRTKFTATGPTGKRVSGAVCAGVFKGYTIRITGMN